MGYMVLQALLVRYLILIVFGLLRRVIRTRSANGSFRLQSYTNLIDMSFLRNISYSCTICIAECRIYIHHLVVYVIPKRQAGPLLKCRDT
jgi:hypothetical protein